MAAAARLRLAGVRFEREVHETLWGTREFVIRDDQWPHLVLWSTALAGFGGLPHVYRSIFLSAEDDWE